MASGSVPYRRLGSGAPTVVGARPDGATGRWRSWAATVLLPFFMSVVGLPQPWALLRQASLLHAFRTGVGTCAVRDSVVLVGGTDETAGLGDWARLRHGDAGPQAARVGATATRCWSGAWATWPARRSGTATCAPPSSGRSRGRRRRGTHDGGRARHGGGRQQGRPRGLPARSRHRLMVRFPRVRRGCADGAGRACRLGAWRSSRTRPDRARTHATGGGARFLLWCACRPRRRMDARRLRGRRGAPRP